MIVLKKQGKLHDMMTRHKKQRDQRKKYQQIINKLQRGGQVKDIQLINSKCNSPSKQQQRKMAQLQQQRQQKNQRDNNGYKNHQCQHHNNKSIHQLQNRPFTKKPNFKLDLQTIRSQTQNNLSNQTKYLKTIDSKVNQQKSQQDADNDPSKYRLQTQNSYFQKIKYTPPSIKKKHKNKNQNKSYSSRDPQYFIQKNYLGKYNNLAKTQRGMYQDQLIHDSFFQNNSIIQNDRQRENYQAQQSIFKEQDLFQSQQQYNPQYFNQIVDQQIISTAQQNKIFDFGNNNNNNVCNLTELDEELKNILEVSQFNKDNYCNDINFQAEFESYCKGNMYISQIKKTSKDYRKGIEKMLEIAVSLFYMIWYCQKINDQLRKQLIVLKRSKKNQLPIGNKRTPQEQVQRQNALQFIRGNRQLRIEIKSLFFDDQNKKKVIKDVKSAAINQRAGNDNQIPKNSNGSGLQSKRKLINWKNLLLSQNEKLSFQLKKMFLI